VTLWNSGAGDKDDVGMTVVGGEATGAVVRFTALVGDAVTSGEESFGAGVGVGVGSTSVGGATDGANVEKGAKVKAGSMTGAGTGANVENGAKVSAEPEFGESVSGSLGVIVGISIGIGAS